MHSMVGAYTPYAVKRRRVEIVRGYCYRFIQCSFPCGIIMLLCSLVVIFLGTSQLIYIFHFDGCNQANSTSTDMISLTSTSNFKCNRQTFKVLGITFVVSGSVLLLISLVVTKYARTGEENNVIRTPAAALVSNANKHHHHHYQHHPPPQHLQHYPHSNLLSEHDQNQIIVSIR